MSLVERHIAIVLAAGGSLRLGGVPKQLLMRDGETLVHRTVRLVRETKPGRLMLVIGARAESIGYAVEDMGCDIVINRRWPLGLSSSLATASRALGHHYGPVMLVGCDQPALMVDHLRQLVALAAANPRGFSAVEHSPSRVGMPVVIPGGVLRYIERIRGDHGLAARLNALPREAIARLQAPELQLDVDDRYDLRAAIKRGWIDDEEIDPFNIPRPEFVTYYSHPNS